MRETFEKAMDYIAGSCMTSPTQALEAVMDRYALEDEVELFEKFLEENGCHACEKCEWYTHPGEGDGTLCDECLEDKEEEE